MVRDIFDELLPTLDKKFPFTKGKEFINRNFVEVRGTGLPKIGEQFNIGTVD